MGKWLSENNIPDRTATRVMRLFREYEIGQIVRFDTMSAALNSIPTKRKTAPKPEPQPEPTRPIDLSDGSDGDDTPGPPSEPEQPKMAVDITTGEMVEFDAPKEVTATDDIYAQANRPAEPEPLTARDLKRHAYQ